MREYEISNETGNKGKVQIYKNIYSPNSLITSLDNYKYEILDEYKNSQSYIVKYYCENMDDVINLINKYTSIDKLEETLEYIKKLNNIKVIKKPMFIDILVPSSKIKNLNLDINNYDYLSLLESKIFFIKNTNQYNIDDIIINLNDFIKSSEFEFMEDDEKKLKYDLYNNKLNEIIKIVEDKTTYKYGRDYIRAIRLFND